MAKAKARKFRLTTKTDVPLPLEALTSHHTDLLALFDRYDYLPWPWLHALHPGKLNENYFGRLCRRMMKEPNKLLVLPDGQISGSGLHQRHAVYARNGKRRQRYDDHNLLINIIRASLELGSREHGYRLIHWKDILGNPRLDPRHRDELNKRRTVFLELSSAEDYEPDDCIIIDYGNDRYRYLFIEADRGTEPLTSKLSIRRKTIESMFDQIRTISEKKLFRQLGFTHALFLVVTTDPIRMRSMIELEPPRYVLFQSMPDWCPFPTTCLLERPWEVSGEAAFTLKEPPNGAVRKV
ncbi:MAG: hypothetical protein E6G97_09850 [Alphaproteobacteria bacterium]|nr:MAG: hypothetical protein E6G97_09850 [Alphaproteobacteria bacterium]